MIKHLRKRIKNLQQELHKKTSSWLCKNYKNIIIPDFESVKRPQEIKGVTRLLKNILSNKLFFYCLFIIVFLRVMYVQIFSLITKNCRSKKKTVRFECNYFFICNINY